MKYFLDNVLKVQEEMQHHAKLVILNRDILVTTYTHDIDDVTAADLELARICDEIYEDVYYINQSKVIARERENNIFG